MLNKKLITSSAVLKFDWATFKNNLNKMLIGISRSTITPVNGDRWEEVIVVILRHMNHKVRWEPGSHQPGADIWIEDFSISAKSGNIKKSILSISSYRLTRFGDLKQMKTFIDSETGKNFDIHLCCARTDIADERIYRVYVIDNHLFSANDMEWSEMYGTRTAGVTGWRGIHQNGIVVEIRKKMSNQLWIKYPLELCNQITEIRIEKSQLGCEAASFITV